MTSHKRLHDDDASPPTLLLVALPDDILRVICALAVAPPSLASVEIVLKIVDPPAVDGTSQTTGISTGAHSLPCYHALARCMAAARLSRCCHKLQRIVERLSATITNVTIATSLFVGDDVVQDDGGCHHADDLVPTGKRWHQYRQRVRARACVAVLVRLRYLQAVEDAIAVCLWNGMRSYTAADAPQYYFDVMGTIMVIEDNDYSSGFGTDTLFEVYNDMDVDETSSVRIALHERCVDERQKTRVTALAQQMCRHAESDAVTMRDEIDKYQWLRITCEIGENEDDSVSRTRLYIDRNLERIIHHRSTLALLRFACRNATASNDALLRGTDLINIQRIASYADDGLFVQQLIDALLAQ